MLRVKINALTSAQVSVISRLGNANNVKLDSGAIVAIRNVTKHVLIHVTGVVDIVFYVNKAILETVVIYGASISHVQNVTGSMDTVLSVSKDSGEINVSTIVLANVSVVKFLRVNA